MSEPFPAAEQDLLAAALALTRTLDVQEICRAVLAAVERLFDARSAWILIHDPDADELATVESRGRDADVYAGVRLGSDAGIVGSVFRERRELFVPDVRQEDRWFDRDRVHQSALQSVFTVPLEADDEVVGVVGFDSPRFTADRPPGSPDTSRLRAIGAIAACAIRSGRLLNAVEDDRRRLRRLLEQRQHLRTEVHQLRTEMRDLHPVGAVVGESDTFRSILEQVEMVAPSDSTVLLVGETGTGKELIARTLHERSRRRSKPFVPVNCAALPDTLVESELFGYEKGAFTGAFARKAGKFEFAHLGTLFLDEIGDLLPQAQAKLLRVLQEREVHRIGGLKPTPVDVRLIAATNRDLAGSMGDGQFRADLFYRISVFPIRLPPLRERRQDIPALVAHFLGRFAERQHKPTPRLGAEVLELLTTYEWPGNIRELQNVIERAVILVRGPEIGMELIALHQFRLETPAAPLLPAAATAQDPLPPVATKPAENVVRFSDAERRAIMRALEVCGWRISGRRGAAETLGLKPTTLHAKMKKLGITRPSALATNTDTAASGL